MTKEPFKEAMNFNMQDYLQVKERHHHAKQALFSQYQLPVISIVANAIGEDKLNPFSAYVVSVIHEQVEAACESVICHHEINALGYTILLVVKDNAIVCKEKLIAIETHHPCGRLVDCDVFFNGKNITRNDMHIEPRQCLVCSDVAKVCMRHQRHTPATLKSAFESRVIKALKESNSEKVRFALLSECLLTPKFGLVTPYSKGIHTDMEITTFLRSIQVLIPYFKQVETLPLNQSYEKLFQSLRALGQTMEAAMFNATLHINTHKGAIFLFLCVMMAQRLSNSIHSLSRHLALLTRSVLDDFKQLPTSEGLKQFRLYATQGVRGFVTQGGEPLLFEALHYLNSKTFTQEHGVNTLLLIMSRCADSTIIKKGGLAMLHHFQQQAKHAFENPAAWDKFETWCLQHHLSAGGAADIFALVMYLNLCNKEGKQDEN